MLQPLPYRGMAHFHSKNKCGISDDFGLRKPRHSEKIYAKKRYTSIVARVVIVRTPHHVLFLSTGWN